MRYVIVWLKVLVIKKSRLLIQKVFCVPCQCMSLPPTRIFSPLGFHSSDLGPSLYAHLGQVGGEGAANMIASWDSWLFFLKLRGWVQRQISKNMYKCHRRYLWSYSVLWLDVWRCHVCVCDAPGAELSQLVLRRQLRHAWAQPPGRRRTTVTSHPGGRCQGVPSLVLPASC